MIVERLFSLAGRTALVTGTVFDVTDAEAGLTGMTRVLAWGRTASPSTPRHRACLVTECNRALLNDTDFVHYVAGRTPAGRWGILRRRRGADGG